MYRKIRNLVKVQLILDVDVPEVNYSELEIIRILFHNEGNILKENCNGNW